MTEFRQRARRACERDEKMQKKKSWLINLCAISLARDKGPEELHGSKHPAKRLRTEYLITSEPSEVKSRRKEDVPGTEGVSISALTQASAPARAT